MTNRKSHKHFRLVPKSMILNDLEWPLRILFQNTYVFGSHYENLNEDRPTLPAGKMYPNDSNFWQYKIYADIRGGSLERGRRKWQFSVLSLHISSEALEERLTLLYTVNWGNNVKNALLGNF